MIETLESQLRTAIAEYPNFPKAGILFRDVMPILLDPVLRDKVFETLTQRYAEQGITAIAGPEARGFLIGSPLADRLKVPFVPIRKPGKLPGDLSGQKYKLEYGTDELQIQRGILNPSDRVVVIDDLLATGGTAEAACRLIEQSGAQVVENVFVIELTGLGGREKLGKHTVHSLVQY